jgi:hypothetical protein
MSQSGKRHTQKFTTTNSGQFLGPEMLSRMLIEEQHKFTFDAIGEPTYRARDPF